MTHPAQQDRRRTGLASVPSWPLDRGPLATLRDLGLIPDQTSPAWVDRTWMGHDSNGRRWRTDPAYLSSEAVQHLAALTLEGYSVRVRSGTGGCVLVDILRPTT